MVRPFSWAMFRARSVGGGVAAYGDRGLCGGGCPGSVIDAEFPPAGTAKPPLLQRPIIRSRRWKIAVRCSIFRMGILSLT